MKSAKGDARLQKGAAVVLVALAGYAAARWARAAWRKKNMGSYIHMNSAGAALQDAAVVRAVVSHLELECAIGGYAAATRSANNARHQLARLLNCSGGEIALFESAQAAWSRAVYSLDLKKVDRIVCFEMEYAGNAVAFLQLAQRTGATVEVLPLPMPFISLF
jgi:selenocysteine lyase/cysteine desulfurase